MSGSIDRARSRVRWARADDAELLGEVHVAAWRAAYRGLVPQSVLDALDPWRRAAAWRDLLDGRSGPDTGTLVAVSGTSPADGPRGFVRLVGHVATSEAPPPPAEVRSLYVDPGSWRRGLGTLLLDRAVDELRAAGVREVRLWVLTGNRPARAFYASRGWSPSGRVRDVVVGGQPLPEVEFAVRW